MCGDRSGCARGRGVTRGGLVGRRQQLGRIGVEAEQQLALARADQLRDAVAEVHRPAAGKDRAPVVDAAASRP
jgi:hypothetical protein